MTNQERYLDPSLQWAIEKYLGEDFLGASKELVLKELRETLFSIIDNYLEETNQKEPEFKPELLAPKRRIKVIMEVPLSKARALLIPQIGGFVLKIKSDMHPFQRRFSCAHEIGHTFFFNIDVDPPRKEFQQQKSRYWVEEEFSNAIAREILLPAFSIEEKIQKELILPSINSLRYLSSLYQVSFDVLRLKLINDMSIWNCVIFKAYFFDGKVIINKRDVSKGVSFRNVRIPNASDKNSNRSNLFTIISSTIKKKRLMREKIIINEKEYLGETMLLSYEKPVVIGIITAY